jgi:OPT family oligopeptide transporter
MDFESWSFYYQRTYFDNNHGQCFLRCCIVLAISREADFSATDIIIAQEVFYGQHFGYIFQVLLTLTTQMLGYGIAGVCRRWLVYPSAMIWPALLATTTFLNTLHNRRNPIADGWTISRYRFFLYVMMGSYLWYFIPGFISPALSTFAFMTWIFPRNVVVNQIFGMTTGMAIFPITFDWSQIIGFLGSPLTTPWFAAGNIVIGLVLWEWIICPILHFSNVWEGLYFPFSSYKHSFSF